MDRNHAAQAGDRRRAPGRGHGASRPAGVVSGSNIGQREAARRTRPSPARHRRLLSWQCNPARRLVSANYAALACPDLPLVPRAAVPPRISPTPSTSCASSGAPMPASSARSRLLVAAPLESHRMFAVWCWPWSPGLHAHLPGVRRARHGDHAAAADPASPLVANVATTCRLVARAAHNAGAAAMVVFLVVLTFLLSVSTQFSPIVLRSGCGRLLSCLRCPHQPRVCRSSCSRP